MFRTHAIILSTQKIRDQFTRVILFTKEYWKINSWHKKGILPDITSLCEIQIERENGFNIIKNIEKIRRIWDFHISTYDNIHEFLTIFHILTTLLPDSSEHRSIFDDIENIITLNSIEAKPSEFYTMIQARILKKLWYLDDARFEETPLHRYIYDHLEIASISAISHSKPIPVDILQGIRLSILESEHRITYHP